MNNKLSTFLIILSIIAFSACTKEQIIDKAAEKENYGVSFSIEGLENHATRAYQSGGVGKMAALDREKTVANLYAVVYQGGVFYKVEKTTLDGAKYKFDMQKAGSFDVYLVANPDADLINKMKTKAASPGLLKNLIATQEVGANNKAKDFLMTAEPFTVTTQVGKTVKHATAVSLVRLAARVDFYNTVPDLEMTKLRFKNRVTNSVLVDSKTHNGGLTLTSNKTYQAAEGLKATDCIGAIYSYENNEKGSVAFTLEATYKGAAIQKEITFDNLPLKRNHLYHVIISEATTGGGDGGGGGTIPTPNPEPNKLTVNIAVVDWNEGVLIEWKGDKLIGGTPTFTATGIGVTTTPAAGSTPAQNPTQVNVPAAATSVTITALGDVTYPILEAIGTIPADIIFTKGTDSKVNGKFQRVYTINVGANAAPKPSRSFKFAVINPLNKNKKREFTLQQNGVTPPARPKMAIEYVTEYNIGHVPGKFATSHANDQSGYYNWREAKSMTFIPGYHLPSIEEWAGIIPYDYVKYSSPNSYNEISELIAIKGVTKTYTADYRNKVNGITYALRLKGNGNKYLAAYRYERVGNFEEGDLNTHLKVTVRYLGASFKGTVADIENESYWSSNNGNDVSRIFPAAGYEVWSEPIFLLRGAHGHYWADLEVNRIIARIMFFNGSFAYIEGSEEKAYKISVRLFYDD